MRKWLSQGHNRLAIVVWGFGLACLYAITTNLIGSRATPPHPMLWIGLTAAIPLGWGILKRQAWAKWGIACSLLVMAAMQGAWGVAHRNALVVGIQLLSVWGSVRLLRWDITGETEWQGRMDQISEVLRRTAPPALAPSSVTLKVMSMPPVTHESLAAAVESAFGRRCTISLSDNNLDLGLEAACTTPETAVVGGPGGAEYGHLIIGANPVGIDLTWAAAGGEGPDDKSPVTFLTIGTPRQIRRTEVSVNGYDWTMPLVAALWTPSTKSATIDEERITFTSAEELLAWKNARAVSNN